MLLHPRTPLVTDPGADASLPTNAAAGPPEVLGPTTHEPQLQLTLRYTDPHVAVLSMSGELDLATTPRLAQLLWPRLQSTLAAIIIDLSQVRFLGVDSLELLAHAHIYAAHRGIAFNVVTGTRAVDRALAASGMQAHLACFATAADARVAARPRDRTATPGPEPQSPISPSTPARTEPAPPAVTQP